MTDDALALAPAPAASPRFERGRFDLLTIAFHWITAVLVLALFAIGWSLDDVADEVSAVLLLTVHRSIGVTVWVLTVARLTWRRTRARLPPFPPSMPHVQQWAAKANEYGLYALLIAQPVLGFGSSVARGRTFLLFGLEVPPLMERNRELAHQLLDLHALSAWILAGLIGLHAAAGLMHAIVFRDGVFPAILPWTRRARR